MNYIKLFCLSESGKIHCKNMMFSNLKKRKKDIRPKNNNNPIHSKR